MDGSHVVPIPMGGSGYGLLVSKSSCAWGGALVIAAVISSFSLFARQPRSSPPPMVSWSLAPLPGTDTRDSRMSFGGGSFDGGPFGGGMVGFGDCIVDTTGRYR